MSDSINRYTPPPRLESLQANLVSHDEFENATAPPIATGLATLKEEDSKGGVMPFGGIVPSEAGPVRNRAVELLSPERGRPAESHRASSLNPYMYGDGTLSTTSSHSTGAQERPRPIPEGKHASSMLYGAPHKSDPIDDPKELEPIVGPAPETAATPASREKTLGNR